ncbi:MAG: hypothetical protein Kow00124_16890 [Anaerolineae bacterium]
MVVRRPRTQEKDFERVVRLLTHRDREVRIRAAEMLGRLGDRRAVDPLLNALAHDKDWCVRCRAALALGTLADRRAVDGLIHALKDCSWCVRRDAARALGMIGDPRALEPLARLRERHNPEACWEDWDVHEVAGEAIQQIEAHRV